MFPSRELFVFVPLWGNRVLLPHTTGQSHCRTTFGLSCVYLELLALGHLANNCSNIVITDSTADAL